MFKLIDPEQTFFFEDDGTVAIKNTQRLDDQWLARLREEEMAMQNQKLGEFVKLGEIPAIFVTKWLGEGFNIFDPNVKARDIQKRLKRGGLEAFMTTRKRL
ncbi:hypothetical protein [Teichococcus vastitatis]|uniref:hypothetical protein n=1 Tax=Teichococcus vastitatis TaxID=2307076 RepID=UPI000E76A6EE|nr:hypothetical protein [Pseudoroseomonas vastitatis]